MTYISLILGTFYLISCPILVCLNIENFDYYCAFYLMIPSTAYTIYNCQRIMGKKGESTLNTKLAELLPIKKCSKFFTAFSIVYTISFFITAVAIGELSLAAFTLFPLTIKVVILDIVKILSDRSEKQSVAISI